MKSSIKLQLESISIIGDYIYDNYKYMYKTKYPTYGSYSYVNTQSSKYSKNWYANDKIWDGLNIETYDKYINTMINMPITLTLCESNIANDKNVLTQVLLQA